MLKTFNLFIVEKSRLAGDLRQSLNTYVDQLIEKPELIEEYQEFFQSIQHAIKQEALKDRKKSSLIY